MRLQLRVIKDLIEREERKITIERKSHFYLPRSTSPSTGKLEANGKTTVDEMFSG